MKLSILMMVKNESKFLEQCLQALMPIREALCSELIIVDTGSTDNTVSIAGKYTDRVYFHDWHNDFSEIRNITLDYAKGEWGLMIDGDEIFENVREIVTFLSSSQSKNYNTGLVPIRNIADLDEPANTPTFLSPRLFRITKDFRFTGAIHEQSCPKAPFITVSSTLVHYGYVSNDKELMEKKFQRNGSILKAELEKDPENIYYWYNLSLTYWMHLDHELSVEPALKACLLAKKHHTDQKPFIYVYLQLIKSYINTDRYKEAEVICDEALAVTKEDLDLCFFAGRIKFLADRKEESRALYEKYLSLLEKYRQTAVLDYTVLRFEEAYRDLAVIHEEMKEYDTALLYCTKIKSREQRLELMETATHLFLEKNRIDGLKQYYSAVIKAEGERLTDKPEEVFLQYLYRGKPIKDKNPAEYIQYLENAIKELPDAKGIEIVKLELANGKGSESKELQLLKKQFKDNIRLLIDHRKMAEACELIRQYEEIAPDDLEIAALKTRL